MRVNGIEITEATIAATREHFAQIHRDCITGAEAGKYHVNDMDAYREWQTRMIVDGLAGEHDHTLTFIQRALWLQTGESVPLMG